MPSDYDEPRGYEEDRTERDDYPEEVWNQIEAERRRLEGGGDDDDLDEFAARRELEPEPPSLAGEQLKELEEDRDERRVYLRRNDLRGRGHAAVLHHGQGADA